MFYHQECSKERVGFFRYIMEIDDNNNRDFPKLSPLFDVLVKN